jgi:hypothetical protein
MPSVNTPPLGTPLPDTVRRRIWSHPEITSHSLLVLTLDRFYLAPLAGTPRPEMLSAIEFGNDLDEVFGPLATVVNLKTIQRLELDLLDNSLTIEHGGTPARQARLRLGFATPEAADTCFTRMWRRLGDGYQLSPYQRGSWQSARAPLAALAGILILTALMAILLSVFEDMAAVAAADHAATRSGPTHLPGWLDWKVVCGLGGVGAAISQVWLYRRLTTPPVSLELIRKAK